MRNRVAFPAKCNEIRFAIFAGTTAKLLVMYFEVLSRSAELASPAVAPQHALA
jgi:hypothetical protein